LMIFVVLVAAAPAGAFDINLAVGADFGGDFDLGGVSLLALALADQGGTLDVLITIILECIGCQQVQDRAQALSAAVDDILAHLVDQDDIRPQFLLDALIDSGHVILNEGINFFNFHGLSGSGSCLRPCMLGGCEKSVKQSEKWFDPGLRSG